MEFKIGDRVKCIRGGRASIPTQKHEWKRQMGGGTPEKREMTKGFTGTIIDIHISPSFTRYYLVKLDKEKVRGGHYAVRSMDIDQLEQYPVFELITNQLEIL